MGDTNEYLFHLKPTVRFDTVCDIEKIWRDMNAEHCSADTRQKILNIAAEEIHLHGFQACKTSQIIQKSGISKGALYHHFSSKLELGYAVFDEVFAPKVIEEWSPVFQSQHPVQAMISMFEDMLSCMDDDGINKGCPLNNLSQEMSPIDEGFRLRIQHMMQLWHEGIAESLKREQEAGVIKKDVNIAQATTFMIASIEGAHGLAKNSQDPAVFAACIDGLIDYLERLKH